LGDFIGDLVDSICDGRPQKPYVTQPGIGVDYLPTRVPDDSDRNRTSPIAFTGNKFEFRAVGSSQSAACSNTILNICMADSFDVFATLLNQMKAKGMQTEKACRQIVKDFLVKHRRIIYNENGYTEEWKKEAKRRGLSNYVSTADVLNAIKTEANLNTFERMKIMTRKEFASFIEVELNAYVQCQQIESEAMVLLSNRYIIPAAVAYQNELLRHPDSVPLELKKQMKSLIESAWNATAKLKSVSAELVAIEDLSKAALFGAKEVKTGMKDLRIQLDNIEELVDQKFWPIPTYEQILLTRHKAKLGNGE